MTDIPVPLLLDLWALGHTAKQIAAMVAAPRAQDITRIIEQARDIGEPRAVIHVTAAHRVIGHKKNTKALLAANPEIEVVPLIARTSCKNGHTLNPDNIYYDRGYRRCRECHKRTWKPWKSRATR